MIICRCGKTAIGAIVLGRLLVLGRLYILSRRLVWFGTYGGLRS